MRAWWVQRVSAIYMLLFMVSMLVAFWLHPPRSFAVWRSDLASRAVSIAALVFFAALFCHMWVGLRDVLLDYAKPAGVRYPLLGAVALGLIGLSAWVLWIFWQLQS